MGIALLVRKEGSIRPNAGIPAAVSVIMELPPKALKACVGKDLRVLMAKEGAKAVDVCHAGCNPGLPRPVLPGRSVIAEIPGAAARRREPVPEGKEIVPGLLQESAVLCRADLIL